MDREEVALANISTRYLTLIEVLVAGWIVFRSRLKAILLIAFIFSYIPYILRFLALPDDASRWVDTALSIGSSVVYLVAIAGRSARATSNASAT